MIWVLMEVITVHPKPANGNTENHNDNISHSTPIGDCEEGVKRPVSQMFSSEGEGQG